MDKINLEYIFKNKKEILSLSESVDKNIIKRILSSSDNIFWGFVTLTFLLEIGLAIFLESSLFFILSFLSFSWGWIPFFSIYLYNLNKIKNEESWFNVFSGSLILNDKNLKLIKIFNSYINDKERNILNATKDFHYKKGIYISLLISVIKESSYEELIEYKNNIEDSYATDFSYTEHVKEVQELLHKKIEEFQKLGVNKKHKVDNKINIENEIEDKKSFRVKNI